MKKSSLKFLIPMGLILLTPFTNNQAGVEETVPTSTEQTTQQTTEETTETITETETTLETTEVPTSIFYSEISDNYELVESTEMLEPTEPTESKEETEIVSNVVNYITYRVTAYCACELCCGEWALNRPTDVYGNPIVIGASGNKLTPNVSCASPLDFGTEIELKGFGEVIVEDRTSDTIVNTYGNNIIDIYMTDHQKALEFGVQYMEGVIK